MPCLKEILQEYPLVNIQKAIENCHVWLIYPINMVIFHNFLYVYHRVNGTHPPQKVARDHPSHETSDFFTSFSWLVVDLKNHGVRTSWDDYSKYMKK